MILKKANKEVANLLKARIDEIISHSDITSQIHFERNIELTKTLTEYGIKNEFNDIVRVIDVLDGIYIMIRDANSRQM